MGADRHLRPIRRHLELHWVSALKGASGAWSRVKSGIAGYGVGCSVFSPCQITRETSFRKKPSNSKTNPPRKSRGIHDLLLPLATREMHSAINHMNKASFRITEVDYTTGKYS
jgi:hypothetical protein